MSGAQRRPVRTRMAVLRAAHRRTRGWPVPHRAGGSAVSKSNERVSLSAASSSSMISRIEAGRSSHPCEHAAHQRAIVAALLGGLEQRHRLALHALGVEIR